MGIIEGVWGGKICKKLAKEVDLGVAVGFCQEGDFSGVGIAELEFLVYFRKSFF
ncbi:MAG: hypothetical protein WA004_21215 [Saprospiraceae bacterium]